MQLYKEIENCFPIIENLFTDKELLEFKNTPICDLYLYHFGLGLLIRNNILTENNTLLYQLFIENNITHKDEMSSLIILLFHEYISKN